MPVLSALIIKNHGFRTNCGWCWELELLTDWYCKGREIETNSSVLHDELQEYLEAENLIEEIRDSFIRSEMADGPIWKIK